MLRGETLSCASPRSGLERVMRYMAFDRTICERDGKEESPAKKGRGENQTMFSPLIGKGAVRARTKTPVHGSET